VKLAGWGVSSRLSFLSQTSKGVRLDGWEEEKRREREEEKEGEISEEVERVEQLNMSNGMKTRPLQELELLGGDRFYFLNPLDSVPSSPFFAGWRADEHVASLLHPPTPLVALSIALIGERGFVVDPNSTRLAASMVIGCI
jgi:hypothetical protein